MPERCARNKTPRGFPRRSGPAAKCRRRDTPASRGLPGEAPMYGTAQQVYAKSLSEIREAGLEKRERVIVTPQGAGIGVARDAAKPDGARREVVNFCANNYLGL